MVRSRPFSAWGDAHGNGPVAAHSPEGLPLPSDVDGKESRDDRAGNDGQGVLERIGGIETGHDKNDTSNDVSARQHDGQSLLPTSSSSG
jgi:hypothetical protein